MIQVALDDRSVLAALNGLRQRLDNLTPVMDAIGADLSENIRLGFTVSEAPWGGAWKPFKKRQGQPLRDTGRLMNSIAHRADSNSVVVGTADTAGKAPLHQFGGKKASGRGSGVPRGPTCVFPALAGMNRAAIRAHAFLVLPFQNVGVDPLAVAREQEIL